MIPVILGMGGLIAKVAAASVIPRKVKALSALGGATETIRANPTRPVPEPVSEIARPSEKVLYGRSLPTRNNKQYFGQGVIANGIKLFYTLDQLGSVRELIDSTGVVRADYRYTPYGERTKEAGDLDSDFGYAGLFHHGPSGLDLATYRTYDSAQGRWISRDPLGEAAGYNLYAYCGNNPISFVDPMGLESDTPTGGDLVAGGPGGRGNIYQNAPSSFHNYGPGLRTNILLVPVLPVPRLPHETIDFEMPTFREPWPTPQMKPVTFNVPQGPKLPDPAPSTKCPGNSPEAEYRACMKLFYVFAGLEVGTFAVVATKAPGAAIAFAEVAATPTVITWFLWRQVCKHAAGL